VDSIKNAAFVYPNKILEKHYYVKAPKEHSEVVFTTVPVQFFHRDDWTRMDSEELRIQKSPFDTVKTSTGKEDLLRELMFEKQNLPTTTRKRTSREHEETKEEKSKKIMKSLPTTTRKRTSRDHEETKEEKSKKIKNK